MRDLLGLRRIPAVIIPTSGGSSGIRRIQVQHDPQEDFQRKNSIRFEQRRGWFSYSISALSCLCVFLQVFSCLGSGSLVGSMDDRGAGRVHLEDQLHQGEKEGEAGLEMRVFMQMMMKAQIEAAERAEARRVEEKKEDRRIAEEKARIAEEKADLAEAKRKEEVAEKQALSDRQYDQQMALMEKQAQLGAVAATIHRRELDASKKRERALFSIPMWKEGEDLENYLGTAEGRLQGGAIEEAEWPALLMAKFSGTTGSIWRDICAESEDYHAIKDRVLRACGYTAKLAGDVFFGFRVEHIKGKTADQLYQRGAQLLKRLVAPERLSKGAEFSLVKAWISSIIPKKARLIMEARVVSNVAELIDALQDHLSLEGDHFEGQAAMFGKPHPSEGSKGRSYHSEGRSVGRGSVLTCYTCGKVGHKAADCWQGKSGPSSSNKGSVSSGIVEVKPIICYNCGEVGHKSPQCPKPKVDKGTQKESVPKSLRRICGPQGVTPKQDDKVQGLVNGISSIIVLDSGAQISAVPEDMVAEAQKLDETTTVAPFGSEALVLQTAEVVFEIGGMSWKERVALIPTNTDYKREVLYGVSLSSSRGIALITYMNSLKQEEIRRVTTRSEDKKEKEEESEEAENLLVAKPHLTPMTSSRVVGDVRGVGDSESVSTDSECLDGLVESGVRPPVLDGLGLEEDCVEEEEDVFDELEMDVRNESYAMVEHDDLLVIPPVREGGSGRRELAKDTLSDESLKGWRVAADKHEEGLQWKDGLLYQAVDRNTEVVNVIVLPVSFRKKVLKMAHDGLGHLGGRKVKNLIKQRFSWPGLGIDVIKYCKSCPTCQRCSKTKSRKAPMMERRVLSEPFEVVALDIVGPMPKGKGGCIYLLTLIDMASKWPEAIPLRSTKSKVVAEGLIELIARVGIPLQILSDQGSQFIGSIMAKVCKDLGIEQIKTSPYHPEGNGTIERMHGTLGPMLTKASSLGQDWVTQVPFALFAIRAAPNRETGFSPFDLVYGHSVRTPLDIIHQGWEELEFVDLEVEEWSSWLLDKMEVWREIYVERVKEASRKRKVSFDRKAMVRELEVNDKVLCRIPGMTRKLQESWLGPFSITEKLNRVNYRVKTGRGPGKVLHINNLKLYYEREEEIMRLTIVAEDFEDDEDRKVKVEGSCEGFDRKEVERLVEEYPRVFSDIPGKTGVCKLGIKTLDASPIACHPFRIPDRMKDRVRVELEKLVDLGILVPSYGPWASPIVPVPKPDGSIRICSDYRKLNSVTQSDPYYMSTLEEILERVGTSAAISKLDLSKGFHQIEVEPEDMDKTAIITPFGKFAFTRMPFGLKNAPAIFQRTMEQVLRSCYSWAAPYIDDVLVFSENVGDHAGHLREVLDELECNGLTVKLSKCAFGQQKVEYLGHLIGGGVMAVPAHRATAMAEYLLPKTKRQLRSFLGAASYYRKFVDGFARYTSALSPATSLSAPATVDWTRGRLEAFEDIKVSLVDCCVLTIPTIQDTFTLTAHRCFGEGNWSYIERDKRGEGTPCGLFQ